LKKTAVTEEKLRSYAESWGVLFEQEGLPRTSGRIWGWLLVCSPGNQSVQQLCDALQVTKGSISTNTRLLERAGLIRRMGVSGSKQTHYRVRSGAFEALLQEKLGATLQWLGLADQGLGLLEAAPPERARRLQDLREFYAFIEKEQRGILKRWKERRARKGD